MDFLVIGGGLAGILSASILGEDYRVLVVEKKPIEDLGRDIWILIDEGSLRNLEKFGLDLNQLDVDIYDEIQVHDANGRVLLEYSYPLAVVELRKLYKTLIENLEVKLKDKSEVLESLVEKDRIRKIKIANKKSEVVHTNFLIDASGLSFHISKKSIAEERYRLYTHNVFRFFQGMFLDAYGNIDKSMLHLTICDISTPGGFSWAFIVRDRAYVMGFHNEYLSSVISPEQRVNIIRNSLGIFGRFSRVHQWRVLMGHPMINPTYKNVFVVGMANLSIYPLFTSGIGYNSVQTSDLAKTIIDVLDSETELDNVSYRYSIAYLRKHIHRGVLNDILRLLLLGMRSYQIEGIACMVLELMSIMSKSLRASINHSLLMELVTELLSDVGLTKRIQRIANMIIELYKVYERIPKNIGELIKDAIRFNAVYDKKVGEILNKQLCERISLTKFLASVSF